MKPLPDIYLYGKYSKDLFSATGIYSMFLGHLMEKIMAEKEPEKNPVNFKNYLMTISQLYTDGILEKNIDNEEDKSAQWEALSRLNLAGKKAVGSFYRGEAMDFADIREILKPCAADILKYGNTEDASKPRHLFDEFQETNRLGVYLSNNFY